MTSSATATPSKPHTTVVLRSAILSRLLLLALTLIWRTLLSPYDTSASLNPTCLTHHHHHHRQDPNAPVLFPSLASAIENSVVWDSVYFVRIALCGYEYEQSYAFLPLLPLAISFISRTGPGWSFSSFHVDYIILFYFNFFANFSLCAFGTVNRIQSGAGAVRLRDQQHCLCIRGGLFLQVSLIYLGF